MKNMSTPKIIWFIDDDPIINQVNKRLCELSSFGNDIITFTSPKSALVSFTKCIEDDFAIPDLIFLDFMMPKMNGIEFLEKLESLSLDLHKKSRIIFLSSTELEEDMAKIRSRTEIKFLSKPLTRAHIDSLKLFFERF